MRPKHILIIMSDQCRADALGPYGNTRAQTPAIDANASAVKLTSTDAEIYSQYMAKMH